MAVPVCGFFPLRTLSFAKISTQSDVQQMQAKACIRSDSALKFHTIKRNILNRETYIRIANNDFNFLSNCFMEMQVNHQFHALKT